MARGGLKFNNFCPECGQQFEILNGDVQFSLNLHLQSHKSLETITQEIDQRMKNVQVGPKKASKKWDYTCPECKENVEIFNNDISFSLQHHAQKHKPGRVESKAEDQSSTSSGKSKNSEKKPKNNVTNPSVPVQINILDGIFDSMPPGLKFHRGFVSENENGKALCNICKVTIDSMFNVSEHLKTKSHEDKTITFFTNMLPADLRHVMEFVSFYGSNLCCNLCRNKIDLCSDNPYKTIIGIMTHNASKGHLQYKASEESNRNNDGATVILKSLSMINPVVNNNKHLIECKMQPQFKCKMCEKMIAYDENEKTLYQNFDSHFTSKGHVKCVQASSVFEAFNLSQFPGKEKHNLIVIKGNIHCNVCNCPVEVNLQELITHVKQPPKSAEGVSENITSLKELLNSLPPQLRNTTCVVEGAQGQVKCLVCKSGIPANPYNLATHLSGKSHKNKAEQMEPANERKSNQGGNPLTEDLVLLKNLFENIPLALRKHTKYVKVVSKEKLHCSVCNYDVPAHSTYLLEHLQGAAHIKSVELFEFTKFQEQRKQQAAKKDILLDKLKKTDGLVRNCAKYLIQDGQQYKCCLCDGNIGNANDEKTLKANILGHINGQKHKKSLSRVYDELLDRLEVSDPRVKADKQFLQKQQGGIYCSLCSCSVSAATDFGVFSKNLLQHLTGSQHNSSKLKSVPPPVPFSSNDNSGGPMKMDFLKSFPLRFHDDVGFLKQSSVEGFLSCTLCNCIINPHYLKEHFEDMNHVQKKNIRQPQMSTTNQSDDQAVLRNMGTLISLLGNIDKKLSRPAN